MELVSRLKNLWALQATGSSVSVSNSIFALQYKYTSIVLIFCSIFVANIQFIFRPIICTANSNSPTGLNTLCWMSKSFRTHLIPSANDGVQINYGSESYHSYYQWFFFVLLVQSVMFYLPGHFWISKEKGRMKKLVMGLDSPILSEENKRANTALIVKSLLSSRRYNRRYFIQFAVAEAWNFINVVGQVHFVNYAFGDVFSTYGLEVIAFTGWEYYERYDPLVNIFPKVIECTLYRIASTGDVMKSRTICALPVNEISEKIYILLWFWFCILAIFSGLALSFRFVVAASSKARFLVTRFRDTACDADLLETVVKRFGFGDWFVLDMLAKNVDPQHFRDIVYLLAREFDK